MHVLFDKRRTGFAPPLERKSEVGAMLLGGHALQGGEHRAEWVPFSNRKERGQLITGDALPSSMSMPLLYLAAGDRRPSPRTRVLERGRPRMIVPGDCRKSGASSWRG